MRNKEEQIKRIANKVSTKYELIPPVDFNILVSQGKCIIKEEHLNVLSDGYVKLDEHPPIIFLNSDEKLTRRVRFTIAHELGHIFVPWHDDITTCAPENIILEKNKMDIQELEANIFAMELLMPNSWIKKKLKKYNGTSMRIVINEITNEAETSIMATLYAIQNAFESGNVLILKTYYNDYPKHFIGENTLTSRFRDTTYEDVCKALNDYHESLVIGRYHIDYYKLAPCPRKDQVLNIFNDEKDLKEVLYTLSDGKIYRLLHCLDQIIECLPICYHLTLYKDDECYSCFKKKECIIGLEYNLNFSDALLYVSEKFDSYGVINLEGGLCILWIEEPQYNATKVKHKEYDSKELLKVILVEVYDLPECKKRLQQINGIIGYTNGENKKATWDELFSKLKIKLECNKELEVFTKHDKFNEFVSLRSQEIIARR